MISSRQLFDASTVTPPDFGPDVVSPDLDEQGQLAAAIVYIEIDVMPGVRAEVSVPFRRALGNNTVPATYEGLKSIFGPVLVREVVALWDAAETSFGRSEINKRIDTNAASYDKDSDQDRIQANQRLNALLDFVANWRREQSAGRPASGGRYGTSVSTAAHYDPRNALLVGCASVNGPCEVDC